MRRQRVGTRIATGTLIALLLAAVADAQSLKYGYRSGDTVSFGERLHLDASSRGPAGSVTATLSRDARIVFAFVRPDSVRAWYDSLSISASGPNGSRSINAKEALRLPFALSMSSDGVVKTLSIPTFPSTLRDLGQFNPQFDDFIPLMPPIGATPGGSRTDTITHREAQGENRTSLLRRIVQSKYAGDTTIAGERAVVIDLQSSVHVERTSPVQGGTYVARLLLDGTENGTAIITRSGRLIERSRSGDARGSISYKAGGTDVSVPQHYRYRITLVAER
jgi:hypothetical protein